MAELLEIVEFLDALMPENFKDKDRRGALYFRAQVVELQVMMQISDDLTMR